MPGKARSLDDGRADAANSSKTPGPGLPTLRRLFEARQIPGPRVGGTMDDLDTTSRSELVWTLLALSAAALAARLLLPLL